jgi:hypothetical protein
MLEANFLLQLTLAIVDLPKAVVILAVFRKGVMQSHGLHWSMESSEIL